MKKTLAALMAFSFLAAPAAAHEVWIKRDGNAPARIYLGEPAEAVPESGDPEFPKLKAPMLFAESRHRPAPLVRRADHIEAAVSAPGDLRLSTTMSSIPGPARTASCGASSITRAPDAPKRATRSIWKSCPSPRTGTASRCCGKASRCPAPS